MIERRASSLSLAHRRMVYLTTGLLWLSGVLWLYWQLSSRGQDLEGAARDGQVMVLKIHGAVAMVFLILLGTLYPIHMRSSWRQEKNRASGGSLVAVCLVLTLTGWGLYYIGYEPVRHALSQLHIYIGLALPVIIYLHVLFSKRYTE